MLRCADLVLLALVVGEQAVPALSQTPLLRAYVFRR